MHAMGSFTWLVLRVSRMSSRSRSIVRNINDRFWSTDTISTNTSADSMSTSGADYVRMAAKMVFEALYPLQLAIHFLKSCRNNGNYR